MTNSTTTNSPVKKLRSGSLSAAIWQNESKHGPMYSVTVERTYKADQDGFATSSSFRQRDLLPLARLIEQAFDVIASLPQESSD